MQLKPIKITPSKLPLGLDLEIMADQALAPLVDKAISYVEQLLKQLAKDGDYSITIFHSDIAEHCGASDWQFMNVLIHLENWVLEQKIQIIYPATKAPELSLAWGVGKYPEGFKSVAIEGVRG